jgi:hypothetical protein
MVVPVPYGMIKSGPALMIGKGSIVTGKAITFPVHKPNTGVIVYVTIAGILFEEFISVCMIGDPTPEEKPVALPLVKTGTQEKEVPDTFEFRTMLVFDIEQNS